MGRARPYRANPTSRALGLPTPPTKPGDPLTDQQARAWAIHQDGHAIREVARRMGVNFSTARQHIEAARFKATIPPGIQDALAQTGLNDAVARFGYRKIKDPETGSFNTVMWKLPEAPAEDIAQRFRDILENMEPAPAALPPKATNADLLTLYPLADVHLGQLSWGRESGEDYDIKTACQQLRQTMADLIVSCPESETAVILNTGDFFHANNERGETERGGHSVDTDGRLWKVIETGVEVTADLIDAARRKHKSVTYRALRGNHDNTMHMALTIALAQRYRNDPRVEVACDPADFFVMEWGRCLLAAHHGDKAKPEQMVLWLAEHDLWKPGQFRHLYAGHLHHDAAKDIGGVRFERLRAFTAKDAYAAGNAYSARRSVRAVTFHKERGEIAQIKRHL